MEQFLKEFQNLRPPDEGVDFNVGYFDQYQFDTFIDTIDKRPDADVIRFFRTNLSYIAEKLLNNQWGDREVLTSDKFLRCYTQAVMTMPVNGSIRIATNKVLYFILININKAPMFSREGLTRQALDLGAVINGPYVEQLISCDLTKDVATDLCISRFSNISEEVNIKRLNFDIACYGPSFMDEQTIVYIYEKLFDRIGSLFKWTMLEYYTPDQWANELNENFNETYSAISLAILDIVNNMPMEAIRQVISGYVTDWLQLDRPPTRFSLRALSADYSRINTIVDALMKNNIYVP